MILKLTSIKDDSHNFPLVDEQSYSILIDATVILYRVICYWSVVNTIGKDLLSASRIKKKKSLLTETTYALFRYRIERKNLC